MAHDGEMTIVNDYQRLARLFLLEVDEETRSELQGDPRFSPVLPEDLQTARVEFTRLFTMSVYPYASVFLDAVPEMNTESTAHVEKFYERVAFEFRPEWMVGTADALGAELECGAWLMERGRADQAVEFLREFLVPWAPVACLSVERNAHLAFYRTLARVTREFLLEEAERLNGLDASRLEVEESGEEERDLHWVSEFLIAPARCGVFLSKDDLRAIAAELELPIGFGERGFMVTSLLKSAGMQDCIPQALGALHQVIGQSTANYASWVRAYPRSSILWQPWLKRTELASAMLDEMICSAANRNEDIDRV